MPGSITLDSVMVNTGNLPVLRGITHEFTSDTVTVVKGKSGSGKSTLLEICAGLRTPDRGTVSWDGIPIDSFSRRELLQRRQKIGYVFQLHALITNYTLFDNVALPLRTMGIYTEREIGIRVRATLEELALFGVENVFPEALSIGQLKSAALARALITDPDLLLLDEPVSGIDAQAASGILAVLEASCASRKRTIIFMTHDKISENRLFDCTHHLDAGKLTLTVSGESDDNLD